jgi:hypothetical protein
MRKQENPNTHFSFNPELNYHLLALLLVSEERNISPKKKIKVIHVQG